MNSLELASFGRSAHNRDHNFTIFQGVSLLSIIFEINCSWGLVFQHRAKWRSFLIHLHNNLHPGEESSSASNILGRKKTEQCWRTNKWWHRFLKKKITNDGLVACIRNEIISEQNGWWRWACRLNNKDYDMMRTVGNNSGVRFSCLRRIFFSMGPLFRASDEYSVLADHDLLLASFSVLCWFRGLIFCHDCVEGPMCRNFFGIFSPSVEDYTATTSPRTGSGAVGWTWSILVPISISTGWAEGKDVMLVPISILKQLDIQGISNDFFTVVLHL